MKKTLLFGGCLALLAGTALADEQLLPLSPGWGLSVQGLSSTGIGLRYKTETSAWLLTFTPSGSDERRTEPRSSGDDVTTIIRKRSYAFGLAWRKYFSSEVASVFVQPGFAGSISSSNVTSSASAEGSSSKTHGFIADLKVGAEMFLSSSWSIEGSVGVAFNRGSTSSSGSNFLAGISSQDSRQKYFRSGGLLATTLYWE